MIPATQRLVGLLAANGGQMPRDECARRLAPILGMLGTRDALGLAKAVQLVTIDANDVVHLVQR